LFRQELHAEKIENCNVIQIIIIYYVNSKEKIGGGKIASHTQKIYKKYDTET